MSKPTLSTSEGRTIARNMVITILTTVLGATVVYFLGFSNKKAGLSKLEKEDVTVQAWKTFVTLENIYTKNSASLFRDAVQFGSMKAVMEESKKESEKFQASMTDLINTDGIDKDLLTVLSRRLENEKTQLPVASKFYEELDGVIDTGVARDWNETQLKDSVIAHATRFQTRNSGMVSRSLTDIEDLSKTLSERYDQPFDMNDFLMIQVYKNHRDIYSILDEDAASQKKVTTVGGGKAEGIDMSVPLDEEYLIGRWDATNGAVITLAADKTITWSVPNQDNAEGTWTLNKEKLTMTIKKHPVTGDKGIWVFNIGNTTKKSFQMVLAKEPFNSYTLTRL